MKIYSPVKNYNGVSACVTFKDGVGECNTPHVIDWFREHGYTVEDDALIVEFNADKVDIETVGTLHSDEALDIDNEVMVEYDQEELEQKSNKELMAMLDARGIEYKAKASKSALIKLLA